MAFKGLVFAAFVAVVVTVLVSAASPNKDKDIKSPPSHNKNDKPERDTHPAPHGGKGEVQKSSETAGFVYSSPYYYANYYYRYLYPYEIIVV